MRVQCEKHFAVINFLAARLRGKGEGEMHRLNPEQPPPQLY